MAEDLDELADCAVCFESYEETGNLVPRILPCSHTFCETCVKQLLKENAEKRGRWPTGRTATAICCPECRVVHPAPDGIRSFPQNKYVLTHIRRKRFEESKRKQQQQQQQLQQRQQRHSAQKCPKHGKDMILFCRERGCNKTICPQCLLDEHRFHDVQELEDIKDLTKSESLVSQIDSLAQKVHSKRNEILAAKQEAEREKAICIKILKNKRVRVKALVDQKFAELIQTAEAELNADLDSKLAAINGNLELLGSMKETSRKTSVTNEEVTALTKTVKDMKLQLRANYSGTVHCKVPRYIPSKYMKKDVARLCGRLFQNEAHYSENKFVQSAASSALASQFKCKGELTQENIKE